jgi:hypothetical protein
MLRQLRLALLAGLPLFAVGCQNLSPAVDWPTFTPIGVQQTVRDENPVFVPLPATEYERVFGAILETLGDYGFEIAEPNRYSGHIEATPRVAPGVVMFLKPGSPEIYERVLASLQTYRHRVSVVIQASDPAPAEFGGYHVEFIVRKELEDLRNPLRSTAGIAAFRTESTVERQTEVIDATFFEPNWIYRGRDAALEQELIRRFQIALCKSRMP